MAETIKIIDNATPWLKGMAMAKPDWERKSLKSAGWMMQQEIKKGIRSGSPGGQKYAPYMKPSRRRLLQGDAGKTRYRPMGQLYNAVGYQYDSSGGRVSVGWLSPSAVWLGSKQEKGASTSVNPKMRALFALSEVPLSKGKSTIVIPARPTYSPMYTILEPKMMPYIEGKILEYANSGAPTAKGGGRNYKVYG